MVPGAPKDAAVLREALAGIEAVVHLARAEEATWEGYLDNDVAVTEALAEAALTAGVPPFRLHRHDRLLRRLPSGSADHRTDRFRAI